MELKNNFFETKGIKYLNELRDMKLPITEVYKVIKLLKSIEELSKNYFDTKKIVIEKFGEEDKDKKGQYKINNIEEFNKEMEELLNISNNIEIEKIKLKNDIEISADFMLSLENFIEIES